MPPCTLRLTLDSSSVRGGDVIVGAVELQADDAFDCRALTVSLAWRAQSRGNKESGVAPGAQTLLEGRVQAGANGRYAFSLSVPPAVWTYSGTSFQLDWVVDAKADIPGSADVHAEEPIEIAPVESLSPDAVNDPAGFGTIQTLIGPMTQSSLDVDRVTKQFPSGCLVALGLLIVGMDLVFLLVVFAATMDAAAMGIVGLSTLITLVVGGAMVYLGLRSRIARTRLGDVTVEVTPRVVRPGETVRCALSFQPRADLEIAAVSLTPRLQETVWRPGRNGRRADRKTVWKQETAIEGRRLVRAGEPVNIDGSVAIPNDAALTFTAPYHWVQWIVAVKVSIRGWVDYQTDEVIIVAPVAGDDESEDA